MLKLILPFTIVAFLAGCAPFGASWQGKGKAETPKGTYSAESEGNVKVETPVVNKIEENR